MLAALVLLESIHSLTARNHHLMATTQFLFDVFLTRLEEALLLQLFVNLIAISMTRLLALVTTIKRLGTSVHAINLMIPLALYGVTSVVNMITFRQLSLYVFEALHHVTIMLTVLALFTVEYARVAAGSGTITVLHALIEL